MPEVTFRVRWPDGSQESCYSPSSTIKDFLTPGEAYPLAEFLQRARRALHLGSERVRARYGYACSSAAMQLQRIEQQAERFVDEPGASVFIEGFEE